MLDPKDVRATTNAGFSTDVSSTSNVYLSRNGFRHRFRSLIFLPSLLTRLPSGNFELLYLTFVVQNTCRVSYLHSLVTE